jgi:hypothetical protein
MSQIVPPPIQPKFTIGPRQSKMAKPKLPVFAIVGACCLLVFSLWMVRQQSKPPLDLGGFQAFGQIDFLMNVQDKQRLIIESIKVRKDVWDNPQFTFDLTIKNNSSEPQPSGILLLRTKQPNRPLPDYSTFATFKFRGGILPGESLQTSCTVECSFLNGATHLLYQLPPGCVLQASIDGRVWIDLLID